jgi:phosphoesterase RecJ-like protein
MSITFNSVAVDSFKHLIDGAKRIVLTCHMSPDGDALGSSLALAQVLRAMGKDVRVITPDEPPRNLRVLPGARKVMAWSSFGAVAERNVMMADLIICLDFNALYRLSRLEPIVRSSKAPKVLIDHHKEPEDFANVLFSYSGMSSTSELLYLLLCEMHLDNLISIDVATCILGGIITDTGGFHYNSNSADLYLVVSALMQRGVDKDWLMRCLIDTQTESGMRLESFAIADRMELFPDNHAALISLTREDLNRFGYKKGDTEGLVNKPLAIPGVIYSVYFREETDYIKVSMRSVSDFPVDLLCKRYYNGGGHQNAAGGEFRGTMEEAIRIFKENLEKNNQLISIEALGYASR